jgi:hypothetical protein
MDKECRRMKAARANIEDRGFDLRRFQGQGRGILQSFRTQKKERISRGEGEGSSRLVRRMEQVLPQRLIIRTGKANLKNHIRSFGISARCHCWYTEDIESSESMEFAWIWHFPYRDRTQAPGNQK